MFEYERPSSLLRPVWWKDPSNIPGAAIRGICPLPEMGLAIQGFYIIPLKLQKTVLVEAV